MDRTVKALEKKADKQMWAGIAGGLGEIGGGICTGLGGQDGTGGLVFKAPVNGEGGDAGRFYCAMGGAISKGLGQAGSGVLQKEATNAEGQVTREQAASAAAGREAERAQEAASDANQALRKVLDRLAETMAAEEASRRAAIAKG